MEPGASPVPPARGYTQQGFAARRRAQRLAELGGLDWTNAESCTSAALSPDGETLAYVSDVDGSPRLRLGPVSGDGRPGGHRHSRAVDTGDDQVRAVSWSPDGEWLCVVTAPGGGERSRVRALRPSGADQRVIAGTATGAGMLGRWQAGGHTVGVVETNPLDPSILDAYAVDVDTGRRRFLATGHAPTVCAFSHDGRYALVRVGRRGERRLLLIDSRAGESTEVLGSVGTVADGRFSPDDQTIYLHTDAGREFTALLALPRIAAGYPKAAEVVVARADAELERVALEPTGRAVACVWNVDGRSELELVELATAPTEDSEPRRQPLPVPADVITSCAFARDGGSLVLGVESVGEPPHVLSYPLPSDGAGAGAGADQVPVRLAPAQRPSWPPEAVVRPEPHRFPAADGLQLTGWYYRPAQPAGPETVPSPTLIWLHGGPEAQERPSFNPLYQALLAEGVAVFAPNVRGSSGFGRRFTHADDGEQRFAVPGDVAAAVRYLVDAGLADPSRVGCAGRSYGGYLTLAALAEHPELFRVGVNVCGIADFEAFFAHTEPWIAAPATSKYGDPRRDADLLHALSPIHRIERIVAPVLVVHGAYDTNVPGEQAEQLVAALRERGGSPGYLLFADEGHEVHGTANRAVFVREVVGWVQRYLLDVDERTA